MLTRRAFTHLTALGLAGAPLGAARAGFAQGTPSAAPVANLTRTSVMLWTLRKYGNFEQRLDVVAQAGFRHLELVDEFRDWTDADWARILARMQALGLSVDAMAGLKSGFAMADSGDMFLAELQKLIPLARRLGCPQIILLSGPVAPGAPAGQQHQASLATLTRAAELLGHANLMGVIEPIDRLENPTIYLDGVTEAFALTRAVGSPHLCVLYDLYHEQRTHGNLIEKLEANIDQVGLIHVADVPGRHEPGSGELNFTSIYRALGRLRYQGVVAMEFYPSGPPVETLARARGEVERDLR